MRRWHGLNLRLRRGALLTRLHCCPMMADGASYNSSRDRVPPTDIMTRNSANGGALDAAFRISRSCGQYRRRER